VLTLEFGITEVTCSATDSAGHTRTTTFDIDVVDTMAPVITVPPPVTAGANGIATYTVTANDSVSGAAMVVCDPSSGSVFPIGITAVSCSAADGAGNTATASFLVGRGSTTRLEWLVSGSGFASNWLVRTASPSIPCSGGWCAYNASSSNLDATYTFTLSEPARVTVFGVPTSSGACGCRTYFVDGGPVTGFSDGAPYAAQRALFTTPLLSTGSHVLDVSAVDPSKQLNLDYLDIVTE
jgi:hypothetical protein